MRSDRGAPADLTSRLPDREPPASPDREPPASPGRESPASPGRESPASPARESPASPARESLEKEKEFLLRSLRDLETERAAGDLSVPDFERLRDDYTARAATVLRELAGENETGEANEANEDPTATEVGRGAGPVRPRIGAVRNGAVRIGAVAVALAVGIAVAVWVLVGASAKRGAGDTITGASSGPAQAAQLIARARDSAAAGHPVTALRQYRSALAIQPDNPEALVGEGWILVQTGRVFLFRQGLKEIGRAESLDPSYSPAHLYRGLALSTEGNYSAAIPEMRFYLNHHPEAALVPEVKQVLRADRSKRG